MDSYLIALFVHLCALLLATAVAALIHFAELRMRAAQTLGELRQWGAIPRGMSKFFPLATLTLILSGAYMAQSRWPWSSGWIVAALIGVALLLGDGLIIGIRGKALGRTLAGDPRAPVSAATARLVRDPIARTLSYANTALSIGIVFIMVTKPTLPGALIALAVAILLGAGLAHLIWRGGPATTGAAASLAAARARGEE